MLQNGEFARLTKEFGGEHSNSDTDEDDVVDEVEDVTAVPAMNIDKVKAKVKASYDVSKASGTGKLEGRLMVKETRTTGSVTWGGKSLVTWRSIY